ncbi:GspH/FimT family pseudopilin [Jeongeupia chitinilytica]|uniref:Type II secretion system protein H n=1 Tax=Jeongeupia chitinilytica TaxID=1041641 RepID=A0ABQ3H2R2_9NEIS|nr:GspH/FimT family pseudopilin [Jeongeupia chitinilytica]GHD63489.1 type IV pilin [Jeongeupia chitinilytica]
MQKQVSREIGLSLIELMIVVALLGIVLSIAAPNLAGFIQSKRLGSAAENLAGDLQYARSEAIKRNLSTYVIFRRSTNNWCYGVSTSNACDCSTSPATSCDLKTVQGSDYRNVALAAAITNGTSVSFDRVRGMPSGALSVELGNGPTLRTTINAIGRGQVCAPDSSHPVAGYKPC